MPAATSRIRLRLAERALSREIDKFLTAQKRYEGRVSKILTRLTGSDGTPVPAAEVAASATRLHYDRVNAELIRLGLTAASAATGVHDLTRTLTERTSEQIRGGEVYLGHFGSSGEICRVAP